MHLLIYMRRYEIDKEQKSEEEMMQNFCVYAIQLAWSKSNKRTFVTLIQWNSKLKKYATGQGHVLRSSSITFR